MNSKYATMAAALAVTALAACKTSVKAGEEGAPSKMTNDMEMYDPEYLILSDAQRQMIDSNNEFALRLFDASAGRTSCVESPLSVSYLMAMLANGADGATQAEILKAIGCEGMPLDDINATYRMIMEKSARLDPATIVSIANYIAVNKDYSLKSSYVKSVEDNYKAGVESMDFSDQKSCKRINKWCSDHTDGMIPSIIDEVTPAAVSYVMNAIFFNGAWSDSFDKKRTRQENFQPYYTKAIRKVDMMHRKDKYQYTANDVFSAVQIPYGNRSYAMTVLLPNEGKSIRQMMEGLTADSLATIMRGMDDCDVDLKLPRFTTEMKLDLNSIISKIGAPSMFSPSTADFSKFATGQFYVSQMLQKAKIEVTEEGTKAAAVTAAVMLMAVYQPDEPRHVVFHAKRPFVYMITERSSGAILFIGQFTGEE